MNEIKSQYEQIKAERDALRVRVAEMDLQQCKDAALYDKLYGAIQGAIIDECVDCLYNVIEGEPIYELYASSSDYFKAYHLPYPITVEGHRIEIARINAVFDADVERLRLRDELQEQQS